MYHPGDPPIFALHALIFIVNAVFVWIITSIVGKQYASLISLQREQEEQNTNAEVIKGVNVITSLSGFRAFVHISFGVMLHLLLK